MSGIMHLSLAFDCLCLLFVKWWCWLFRIYRSDTGYHPSSRGRDYNNLTLIDLEDGVVAAIHPAVQGSI